LVLGVQSPDHGPPGGIGTLLGCCSSGLRDVRVRAWLSRDPIFFRLVSRFELEKNPEGFLRCVAAAFRCETRRKRLAATPVGMTRVFSWMRRRIALGEEQLRLRVADPVF
jgi:hypothetical protein